MSYTFRPAVRENTPLIIGIAGPTKSGKTYSAHRVAIGLAAGGPIAMINAEGARGHQYADKFKYLACDLTPPYRATSYTEALKAAATVKPAVVIIDSASHMHDGPGGTLEWHDEIAKRMAKGDENKLDKMNMVAWVEPKAAENQFIYEMLGMKIPIVLCFRAKEKVKMADGKVIDLGWQPIAGERVAFETIFTLMLPPHSKGVPDLAISDMREPFDELVPRGKAIDEDLGRKLLEWSRGVSVKAALPAEVGAVRQDIIDALKKYGLAGQSDDDKRRRAELILAAFGMEWRAVERITDPDKLRAGLQVIRDRYEAPPPAQAALPSAPAASSPAPAEPAEPEGDVAANLEAVSDLQGQIARAIEKAGLKASRVVALSEKACGMADYHGAEPADLRKLLAEIEALIPTQATL